MAMDISGKYTDLFYECMFFLTNMITNVTKSQLGSLLNRDIVILLIRLLDNKHAEFRLVMNTMEALFKLLSYDHSCELEGEASIKEYFESSGGYDALLAYVNHSNF